SQNCGNILAGVGPWAIEQGLVPIAGASTPVRIYMLNTDTVAIAHVATPNGAVEYEGDARIDGVPGTAAPVRLEFVDVGGSRCRRPATPEIASMGSTSPGSATECPSCCCARRISVSRAMRRPASSKRMPS